MKLPIHWFFFFLVGVAALPAQTIHRAEGRKLFPKGSEKLSSHLKADIFVDYVALEPSIEGQRLNFQGGTALANWKGELITITKDANGKLHCKLPDGQEVVGDSVTSTFRYYGRNRPMYRPMSTEPRFQHRVRQYYTNVTREYDFRYNSNHTSQTYTAPIQNTETRVYYNPNDEYNPRKYPADAPEGRPIPATYYKFEFAGDQRLTVFLQNGQYYLQNPSYLQATTAKGAQLLLVDYNANGIYTDGVDMAMFTESPTQTAFAAKEDVWQSIVALRQRYLIEMTEANGIVSIECRNDDYAGSKEKGELKVDGLPKDAKLVVNGEEVSLPKGGKPIVTDYGKYNYSVVAPGQIDMVGEFVVDGQHPAPTIQYEAQGPAVKMEIGTFDGTPFFMTVVDPEGNFREYDSPDSIYLKPGKNKITILQEGETLVREYNAVLGKPLKLGISQEMFIERARKKK